MKYNYKLVFNDPSDMNNFIVNTYSYVLQRGDWFKAFDFMKRKSALYVCTGNYCCIDNFILSKQCSYGYTITKLF